MQLSVGEPRGRRQRQEAEAFLAGRADLSFGLDARWRQAVRRTYRLREQWMVARRGGAVVGALPWTVMHSPLSGRYLLMGPFASYANPALAEPEALTPLLHASMARARRRGAAYLQLRAQGQPLQLDGLPGRVDSGRFATWTLPLGDGQDALWQTLPGKARQQVRRARREGVTVHEVGLENRLVDLFHRGMRSLGSPFHGRAFYHNLAACWGDRLCCLQALARDGRPAAAAINIIHRGVFHYVYGQNDHALRSTYATSMLYWEMISAACARGCSRVDWGRSERGSGVARFKATWGQARPVHEAVVLGWRRSIPNLNPSNPRLAAMQRIWARLPLTVTRALGPLIVRGIG